MSYKDKAALEKEAEEKEDLEKHAAIIGSVSAILIVITLICMCKFCRFFMVSCFTFSEWGVCVHIRQNNAYMLVVLTPQNNNTVRLFAWNEVECKLEWWWKVRQKYINSGSIVGAK